MKFLILLPFIIFVSCGIKKAPTPPEKNLLPSVVSGATKDYQKENPASKEDSKNKKNKK
jgi:hypothetical protein